MNILEFFLQLETMTWKHKATSGFMIERNQGNIFLMFNKMSKVCQEITTFLPQNNDFSYGLKLTTRISHWTFFPFYLEFSWRSLF